MVFEIPDNMNRDEVVVEQVERSVLEAALQGLQNLSITGETAADVQVAETAAIAHTRLAGAMYWSDDLEKTDHHATQALLFAKQSRDRSSSTPLFLEAESLAYWFLGLAALGMMIQFKLMARPKQEHNEAARR